MAFKKLVTRLKKAGLSRLHNAMNQAITQGDLAYLSDQEMNAFQIAARRWNYIATVEQQKRKGNS
jgi:hypothetical protein